MFPDRSLADVQLVMALRRRELEVTGHGFRSAFRDWAAERTNFSRDVCEMALAHTIKDKAEAAYRRGDLLDKRRALMVAWAGFATVKTVDAVALRAGWAAPPGQLPVAMPRLNALKNVLSTGTGQPEWLEERVQLWVQLWVQFWVQSGFNLGSIGVESGLKKAVVRRSRRRCWTTRRD